MHLINYSPLNFKTMKKSISAATTGAALYILLAALIISSFSSCIVSRGHGCPDARRMVGYGCFGGR